MLLVLCIMYYIIIYISIVIYIIVVSTRESYKNHQGRH